MPTRIQIAKPDIVKYLSSLPTKVLRFSDLARILAEQRSGWRLTQTFTTRHFIDFLLEKTDLQKVTLKSDFRNEIRYVWEPATSFQVALSLKTNSYLSHGTAVFLHELTEQLPKTIYVNAEQSEKPPPTDLPTQERIDRAFRTKQRSSKLVYHYENNRIVLVSGKHTNRLEVGIINGPAGEPLDAAKLERTLIDIAVRPAYAGGVQQVLEAFKSAKSRMSVNVLVATLKRLAYAYPYHQVIGFYMDRAGYEQERLGPLLKMHKQWDFYLTYGMTSKQYDAKWRLFYPEGF